ncbi:NAD-dependent epimerase/dehydratase family protein [Actinomycetes bacterium KLBMP 9797]
MDSGNAISQRKKVLVLGGTSFLAAHLAKRLIAEGYRVVVVDDLPPGRVKAEGAIEYRRGDLTNAGTWAKLSRDWEQIYLLGPAATPRAVAADPAREVRAHALAALHLLDWVGPNDKVFFASSGEVHGDGVNAKVVPVPTDETDPVLLGDVVAPRSAYTASRLLAESVLLHGARAGRSRIVIGRLFDVYGPRMPADHIIPRLCRAALRGDDPLLVPGTHRQRAFCHVDDAVAAMLRLVENPSASGEIVHIGNDKTDTSIGDLARLVLKVAGVKARVVSQPPPTGSAAYRMPDLAKMRRLTGFEPSIGLEEGIRRTFYWYRRTYS